MPKAFAGRDCRSEAGVCLWHISSVRCSAAIRRHLKVERTGPGTEVRIARSDISGMRPGTVSVMPAGLEEQLTRQELADLLAFLKATKWGAR